MNVSYPRRQVLGIGAAVASVAFAGKGLAAPAAQGQTVQWDDKAAEEVAHLLHRMHQAWNEGDLEFIKAAVAEEGFVGTFELTGDEQAAMLNSRQELIAFVEKLVVNHTATSARNAA